MSDCSAKASKQHRTCGACEELYMAPRCNRFGHVMLDENDEPDDDGTTFADYCSLWTPRAEPTLEQRCQQLGQVVRELYEELKVNMIDEMVSRGATPKEAADRTRFYMSNQRHRLEELGVSLDG